MLLVLVSSCTIAPLAQKETVQPLNNIMDVWRINGRISLISEQQNWYAKFSWRQQKQNFLISFTGPLGETELQISQINDTVLLKTASGETYGDDLEHLLWQKTGWKFPVTSLKYWSQGVPEPGIISQVKYDKQNQISDIFQSGWHIQYSRRMQVEHSSGIPVILPKKITATEQNIKIKLIITDWHIGNIDAINHKNLLEPDAHETY